MILLLFQVLLIVTHSTTTRFCWRMCMKTRKKKGIALTDPDEALDPLMVNPRRFKIKILEINGLRKLIENIAFLEGKKNEWNYTYITFYNENWNKFIIIL